MPNSSSDFLTSYDLIVLGSGPGGQRAAVQAAKLKKTVLVIEKEKIGGNCLHTGTIPSKTLREAAINSTENNLASLSLVMAQKNQVVDEECKVMQEQLKRNGVHFLTGTGSFHSEKEIRVKTKEGTQLFRTTFALIATGTHPNRPTTIPFNTRTIFDSDTILNIEKLPQTMLIVGAGVIGCEYASIFAKLGVKVTLFDRRNTLLRGVDLEVLDLLTKHFTLNGMNTILSGEFSDIKETKIGENLKVEITINNEKTLFDSLLYCMGREGNTADLSLESANLHADERGILKVNELYQTAISHIFAVGDIIGFPALAASAGEQGRLSANNMFGQDGGKFPESFPFGIYTIPEISSAGAQESYLTKNNVAFVVGRAYYKELARGKILKDDVGFLKLLIDKNSKKILGVHILGTGATELIHIGQVAMALGATVDFFVTHVFNYPTLAEAYKVAAYNAHNQLR